MPLQKAQKGANKAAKQRVASKNIRELAHARPEWPQKRRVAVGLRAAGVARRARDIRGRR